MGVNNEAMHDALGHNCFITETTRSSGNKPDRDCNTGRLKYRSWSTLVEGDEGCIGPSDKLLCFNKPKQYYAKNT